MVNENSGWVTIKDTHYGSAHEKIDGSAIITSMWDVNSGGLRWSVHFRGNTANAKTVVDNPKTLKEILLELIQDAKTFSVKEQKYEIGATVRELEKLVEKI